MTLDRDEATVSAAIRELRRQDERDAPAFQSIMARHRASTSLPITPRLALVAAAAIAVIGIAGYWAMRPERLVVPREVVALSTWRPMTDVLLTTTTPNMLSDTPRLGASLIAIGDLK